MQFSLHRGDCIEVMRGMPDSSVDSICTDPPYGLKFLSANWDYDVPGVDAWREMLRVLKPGGHLIAFSGARTYHRMVVNIEDAGFEIRDQLMWLYGQGMPKSHDVSKAFDKTAGADRVVTGVKGRSGSVRNCMAGDFAGGEYMATEPSTDAAKQWAGWGSALKPAHEPIVLARKPFSGTIVSNVRTHGTGAINIDACRIALTGASDSEAFTNNHLVTERLPESHRDRPLGLHNGGWKQVVGPAVVPEGRWPANVLTDGSEEVLQAFQFSAGQRGDLKNHTKLRVSPNGIFRAQKAALDHPARIEVEKSAARFFFCSKASKTDREEGLHGFDASRESEEDTFAIKRKNHHATVKPTDVCRWLLRLVTPPKGVTLDPYCGSGSFGKAAMAEGFSFIGIDLDEDNEGNSLGYIDIARARIAHAQMVAFDAQCEAGEL